MYQVVIEILAPDDQIQNLEFELEQNHTLQNWPVFIWSTEKATDEQIKWYEQEYCE